MAHFSCLNIALHELVKWHVFNCFDSSRWSFRYVSGRKTNLTRRTTTWYAMDDIILLHVRIQGKVHCTYTPILPPSGYRQLRNQANRGVCHALETDNPGTSSNPALTICPRLHGYSGGPHTLPNLYYANTSPLVVILCTLNKHKFDVYPGPVPSRNHWSLDRMCTSKVWKVYTCNGMCYTQLIPMILVWHCGWVRNQRWNLICCI